MTFKNVVIFGDSYSTYEGANPEGYAVYYKKQQAEDSPWPMSINETWWHPLLSETDSNLVINDSWSGSTIGYTGYNGEDLSQTCSFIKRLRNYEEKGFFNDKEVDTVFILGGTNDNWAGAPIGEIKYENWEEKDLYSFLPAFCYFVDKAKEVFKKAEIIVIISGALKGVMRDGMKEVCHHHNLRYVEFKNFDQLYGHPTAKGMKDIKDQIIEGLK